MVITVSFYSEDFDNLAIEIVAQRVTSGERNDILMIPAQHMMVSAKQRVP